MASATAAVSELCRSPREPQLVSPLGVWLSADWLSSDEEAALLAHCTRPGARWTTLSGRRVQTLGGLVHEKAGLLAAPLPGWLQPLLARLAAERLPGLSAAPPLNHVLVNRYEAGEGILAHQDGPLYYPAVAILSLGAHTVMTFTPHARLAEAQPPPLTVRVWLPQRSLLLFSGAAYEDYLHGIDAVAADELAGCCNAPAASEGPSARLREGVRISLTCRSVLKTRKALLRT